MNAKEYLTPTIVLVLICLVVTAALAVTYQMTEPVIASINTQNANEARAAVLPGGTEGFTEQTDAFSEGVKEVYVANDKTGVVFTTTDKGFGGVITVMTGVDSKGKIAGVKVTEHAETPGLGTKTMTEEYLGQYIGQATITRSQEEGKTQIDAITGATVSSDAIFRAVNKALTEYSEMGGVLK